MKVKIFSFNFYVKSKMEIENEINAFTEKVEVVDIEQSMVLGKSYQEAYLYITVLYK